MLQFVVCDVDEKRKIAPLGGAVARIFFNVSLAVCPLKLSLSPPYLLDSGAGIVCLSGTIIKFLPSFVTYLLTYLRAVFYSIIA